MSIFKIQIKEYTVGHNSVYMVIYYVINYVGQPESNEQRRIVCNSATSNE